MLAVFTTIPVWAGAIALVTAKLDAAGVVGHGRLPWRVLVEPSPEPGTSIDDNAVALASSRQRQIIFYKDIAQTMREAVRQVSHTGFILVCLNERTHAEASERASLLTHVRAFYHKAPEGRRELAVDDILQSFHFVWMEPRWSGSQSSACRSHDAVHYCRDRASWLGGWCYGSFTLYQSLVAPAAWGSRDDVMQILRLAREEMEASRQEDGPDAECALSHGTSSASPDEGWHCLLTCEIGPSSPIHAQWNHTRFHPTFILCPSESYLASGTSVEVAALVTFLHSTGSFPVFITCPEMDGVAVTHTVSAFARYGRSFAVMRVGAEVRTLRAFPEDADDGEGHREDPCAHLSSSDFGICAAASFASEYLHTLGALPSRGDRGPMPAQWKWLDLRNPSPHSPEGPCVVVLDEYKRFKESFSATVARVTSEPQTTNFSVFDLKPGVPEDAKLSNMTATASNALRSVAIPCSWQTLWRPSTVPSEEMRDHLLHASSVRLLGAVISLGVYVGETDMTVSARPSTTPSREQDRSLALLLPDALRVVSKDRLDQGQSFLKSDASSSYIVKVCWGAVTSKVSVQNIASCPVPLLVVHLLPKTQKPISSEDGRATLVILAGHVIYTSCNCSQCTSTLPCLHIAALCAFCSDLVLTFSYGDGPPTITAPSSGASLLRTRPPSEPLSHVKQHSPNTLLGPGGVPWFMLTSVNASRGREAQKREREEAPKQKMERGKQKESPFFCFCRLQRAEVAREHPAATGSSVARLLGERWNALPQSEKEAYRDLCQEIVPKEARTNRKTPKTVAKRNNTSGTARNSAVDAQNVSSHRFQSIELEGPLTNPVKEELDTTAEEFQRQNPEWYVDKTGEWRCEWDSNSSAESTDGDDRDTKDGGKHH